MALDGDAVITLEGDNGRTYGCRLLGVFTVEGQEYMLLKRVDGGTGDTSRRENSAVVMRLTERDGQAVFQVIESDEEFERAVAYLRKLADQDEDGA